MNFENEEWYLDLHQLIEIGRVGLYEYCEVTQIVIICEETKKACNYFTNIEFSSKYKESKEAIYLTEKSLPIKKGYKLAISQYAITTDLFFSIYMNAVKTKYD